MFEFAPEEYFPIGPYFHMARLPDSESVSHIPVLQSNILAAC